MAQLTMHTNFSSLVIGCKVAASNPHYKHMSAPLPAAGQDVVVIFPSGATQVGKVSTCEANSLVINFQGKHIYFSPCISSGVNGPTIDFHYEVKEIKII